MGFAQPALLGVRVRARGRVGVRVGVRVRVGVSARHSEDVRESGTPMRAMGRSPA